MGIDWKAVRKTIGWEWMDWRDLDEICMPSQLTVCIMEGRAVHCINKSMY